MLVAVWRMPAGTVPGHQCARRAEWPGTVGQRVEHRQGLGG